MSADNKMNRRAFIGAAGVAAGAAVAGVMARRGGQQQCHRRPATHHAAGCY